MPYYPEHFSSTYEKGGGPDLWEFLNSPDNVVRMETATYLSRPAVEPLSPKLFERFGEHVQADRIKQMIGHMVRQIMEGRGYHIDRNGVRITRSGNIFTRGTRYIA